MKINISDIRVNDGRRKIDEENVMSLMNSIREVGLLNPITITQSHILIAGAHRLEACKRLGMENIECGVTDLDGMRAELAEIDENLTRKELNYIDQGEQLLRRKEIYEALHPETRATYEAGAFKGNQHNEVADTVSSTKMKSFAEDTAEKTGISPRHVNRKIQIARDLQPDVKEIVRDAGIGPSKAVQLSRIKEPDRQLEAAEKLASGEIKSVDDFVKPKSTSQIVADIKDTEKDFTCTSDMLLAEYGAAAASFMKGLSLYRDAYYAHAFATLTDEQLKKIKKISMAVSAATAELESLAERKDSHV